MSEGNGKLRVAALGDLHVTETAEHPFRECFAEIVGNPHDLAGALHLGTEHYVCAREFRPWEDRRFDVIEITG